MKTMKKALLVAFALLLAFPAPTLLAKPRPGAKATSSASGGVHHVVQRGESLYSIAEKYYKNRYEYVRLKEYNPWIEDPDLLKIGDIVFVPDRGVLEAPGQTSLNPGGKRAFLAWFPNLSGLSIFGRSIYQVVLILMAYFLTHFSIQGVFVWFAAHLAFVRDVSIKKAMKATLQSESLAFVCIIMAAVVGLMLLYVGTTSPGNPATPELFSMAEDYVTTPTGIVLSGILLVALYGFLAIRFIPPAFGIQAGRAVAVVMLAVLLPHLVGFYLIGHRMGLIN